MRGVLSALYGLQEAVFRAYWHSLNHRSLEELNEPDTNTTFEQLDKQYSFIQPRLINHHADWVPTIAAFYLTKNTQTLDELAREQANLAEASVSTN